MDAPKPTTGPPSPPPLPAQLPLAVPGGSSANHPPYASSSSTSDRDDDDLCWFRSDYHPDSVASSRVNNVVSSSLSSSSTASSASRDTPSGDAAPVFSCSSALSSTSPVSSEREEEELALPSIPPSKGPSPSSSNAALGPPSVDDCEHTSSNPKHLDSQTIVLSSRETSSDPSLLNSNDANDLSNNRNSFTNNNNNTSPVNPTLVSNPSASALESPPERASITMAVHPPMNRPPPLKLHPTSPSSSTLSTDVKQARTPGNTITSFFSKRTTPASGVESSSVELFDASNSQRSSVPLSAMMNSPLSAKPATASIDASRSNGALQPSPLSGTSFMTPGLPSKINDIEKELRDICSELASSIRRELELEDLVDKLQAEMSSSDGHTRTSDYFSDSGYSSSSRNEEIEKLKRAAEQERARLKMDFSQKWQDQWSNRTASESHIQILENQVQQLRRERADISDYISKNRELELALEDTRRKLAEERQVKDNFEDLLTAVRVELEQLRNERDHMRDVIVPQSQQLQLVGEPEHHDVDDLIGEIAALKVENASLAQLHGGKFASLGLSRSRSNSKSNGLMGTGPLSRSNSSARPDRESRESLVEKVKDAEEQRDALHQTLKGLLFRYTYQERQHGKRMKILELELEHAEQLGPQSGFRYGREVNGLRREIGLLRQRAEDALDQKWQCEKGLSGLKMDLDRAEQQTAFLRMLLQEHDIAVPDELGTKHEGLAEVQATSTSLQTAYEQLQAEMEHTEATVPHSPEEKEMASRTETLASHVRQQLQTNGSLRGRLANAIGQGEKEQQLSAVRISQLQNRLRELEERLVAAQQQSEEEMAKHEEEITRIKENHRAQLLRLNNGSKSPVMLSPRPPNSPFGARSPRLDKTTSGDGIPLDEAVQRENLEKRVKELEKALRDADFEMEEVISRMNRAQIDVAELQSDRDYALRQTKKLQAEIQSEREAFKTLKK